MGDYFHVGVAHRGDDTLGDAYALLLETTVYRRYDQVQEPSSSSS